MPQRRQAQQMHVPMSTQKHSKKRLFSSAQGKPVGREKAENKDFLNRTPVQCR